jgi:hypothetical protein
MTRLLRSLHAGCRLTLPSLAAAGAFSTPLLVAQTMSPTPVYRWTTLAGTATTGFDDGPALSARFNNPHGVALDAAGNVYVADTGNHTIRKISAQGVVTTLAGSPNEPGSADGTGSAARFLSPEGVAVDAVGNIYVADTGNATIRKITPDGVVTTVAGQPGQRGTADGAVSAARFNVPTKIFVGEAGSIYVFDAGLRRIAGGTVTTVSLAGTITWGTGETVDVNTLLWRGRPAVDAAGQIYLSVGPSNGNLGPKRIIKRDTAGKYSILASSVASDNKPFVSDQTNEIAMTTDSAGDLYFVSQLVSSVTVYSLFKISPAGTLSAPAWRGLNRGGSNDAPLGLAADVSERIIHTISPDDVVLQSTPQSFGVLAGIPWSSQGIDGTGPSARFAGVAGLALDREGNVLAADVNRYFNVHAYAAAHLRKISRTGESSTIYVGPLREAPPETPAGVALGASDMFLASRYTSVQLREVTPGGTATLIGNGDFQDMRAMTSDSTGRLILADNQQRVHRRSVAGEWSLLAGANQPEEIKDGVGPDARFGFIRSLSAASNGDIYLLDSPDFQGTSTVARRLEPNGNTTTISGNLLRGATGIPNQMAMDAKGDLVLTYNDDTVRLIAANGGEFIIGGAAAQSGVADGNGQAARFYQPSAIVTDPQNNIYIADNAGVTVRKGEFLGYSTTIASQPQSLTVAPGGSAQFSVTASGTPAPSYQWQFNGAAIHGATSSTLTLSNVSAANAGSYAVAVTNTLGSVTSNAATLTVTAAPANPPPAGSSGSGGSGSSGGGAPSEWFLLALLTAAATRKIQSRQTRN